MSYNIKIDTENNPKTISVSSVFRGNKSRQMQITQFKKTLKLNIAEKT